MQKSIKKMTAAVLSILIILTSVPVESLAAQVMAEPVSETEVQETTAEPVQMEDGEIPKVEKDEAPQEEAPVESGVLDRGDEWQSLDENAEARTEQLLEEYRQILDMYLSDKGNSFEEELLQFPESYRARLRQLHEAHPNWVFSAIDTGIDWKTAVAMESRSYRAGTMCYSLLPKYSGKLFLSRKSMDYDISTGSYIIKDGSEWVSASEAAVAYYLDPRNSLTENSIFQFEAFAYEENLHTIEGVEAVFAETDLSHATISYYTTTGKKVNTDMTYGEAVYAAGIKYGISPITLAVKIKQETGASLKNGSISGQFSHNGVSYQGYYNYYNVVANAISSDQGSPIANGLIFAMGDADGSGTTYGRPWTSPVLAIDGGAEHLAERFLVGGRNTIYFKKFNTVEEPYYEKQYMQNLHGAKSEGNIAYQSYRQNELLEGAFVFVIPVYQNMPESDSDISIRKTVYTGKTASKLNLRRGPSVEEPILVEIPERSLVNVGTGTFNSHNDNVERQLYDPYWFEVQYGGYTGYASAEFLKMSVDFSLKKGETKQLQVTCSDSMIYFESSDPAVAKVDSAGVVTGVGRGTCMIYAFNGSGTDVDCVGVCVEGLQVPEMKELSNQQNGVQVLWNTTSEADGYYVYRKTAGGSWSKIASLTGNLTAAYLDTTAASGKTYSYAVCAYSGTATGAYDKTGLSIRRIAAPVLLAPTNGASGINVKWEKLPETDGYEIYRKTADTGWKKIANISGNTAGSYLDKNVESGIAYQYTVKGYIGTVKGAYDKAGKGTYRLLAPELVQPVNANKGITVKWKQTAGAAGYAVYRKVPGGSFEKITTVTGGATVSYTDPNTEPGKVYSYTVRAINGSSWGLCDSNGMELKRLVVPELSDVTNVEKGLQVTWKKITGAEGYYVYRKTGSESWKRIGSTGKDTDKYIDENAAAGTVYTYTVRGYFGNMLSSYDTAGKTFCRLLAPELVQPVNVEKGITVKWKQTAGATGYAVYRKVPGGSFEKIATVTGGATVSYTDPNTESGKVYSYTVRAINGSSWGLRSSSGIQAKRLASPELTEISNVEKGVQVNWKKVTGADGYYVYRKNGSESWKRIGTVNSAGTEKYVDTTAVAGVDYIYTVKGYSGSTAGAYDGVGIRICRLTNPVLLQPANAEKGIQVKWEKVVGADGYRVYRKLSSGGWERIANIGSGSTVSFTDQNVSYGGVYVYTVRALNGTVLSSYNSKGAEVKRLQKPELSGISNVQNGVKLTWKKVTGADGYYVYRKTEGGSWKKTGTVTGGSSVTYTDQSAISGTVYYYTVRACYKESLSGYDSAGKTIRYLAEPRLKSAQASGSDVKVTWEKTPGAEGYYVYHKATGGSWTRISTIKGANVLSCTDKGAANKDYIYTVKAYAGSTVSSYSAGIKPVVIQAPSAETIALASKLDRTVRGYGQGMYVDSKNRPTVAVNYQKAYGEPYNATFLNADSQKISFIFTCGWEYSPGGIPNTGRILDILKQKKVKATFFVTHEYASRNPALVRRMIQEGHTLGSHGYSHPSNGIPSLSIQEQINDTMNMQKYIKNNFGYDMQDYNFSSSYWSESSMALISGMGYRLIFYSINYRDWLVDQQLPTSQVYSHLVNSMHPGAIYFLHTVSNSNVAVLGSVIDEAVRRGYTVETV